MTYQIQNGVVSNKVTGNIESTGSLQVDAGGAQITGNSKITGTLEVTAATTLDTTLAVTGTSTLAAVNASGLITPTSAVGIKGTATNDNVQAGSAGEYGDFTLPGTNATVTITIAAPAVVTYTGHGMVINGNFAGCFAVQFSTTGALPTGISSATTYYAVPIDANTFHIATTPANALAGTFITTTGSQSGTQTCFLQCVLANNTANDVIAFSIGPGDFEVSGSVSGNASGTNTLMTVWTNTVSKTAPGLPFAGRVQQWLGSVSALLPTLAVGPSRYLVSGPTTVFLSVQAAVSVTGAAEGFVQVRRIR